MGCVYSRACIGEICAPRNVDVKEPENVKAAEIAVFSPASSDGEIRDQLNQLSLSRDNEIGITRLSRVSAQFLPPDGSRVVKVPSGNYELRCSFLSQRGYYPDALDKANQDSFCIHTPFGTSPDDHFFGVFDGHGEYGAQCSQFVKNKLCENLLRNSKFHLDAVEACHAAFLMTNSQLHADAIDDSMSGTTAITILVRGRTLYVANSGDSRAVIAERRGNEVVAVDLSIDQTPFRPDEIERVKVCGARVLTLDQIEGLKNPDVQCWDTEEGDEGDPPRLWVQNGMYPGTAFTRSIGDSVAETIGVVANPEIVVLELTSDHPFFVIASDGVFEFLSSQTVVDMLVEFRFAKKISSELDERTFTICGMADSLAPEIVQGKGHGFAADWWALGTFIYFMLQGEMPFGSWRESELTFARIAKGQLTLPHTFSSEAVDLITKLLQVDEKLRLGSQGVDSIKSHPWFLDVDWKAIADHQSPVPAEILSRISQRLENHGDENLFSLHSPIRDLEELNTPEWLQDW